MLCLVERPFLRKSKTSHDTVTVVVAQMTLVEKKRTHESAHEAEKNEMK